MKRTMACVALLVSLTGCFRMSVRSGASRSGEARARTGVSLVGLTTVNVAAGECEHGLSRVDVSWPAWGLLVYFATFGIVAPVRAEYVCAEGGSAPGPELPEDVPPSVPSL
ncbi:hypothetical protein [Pyxidicoccus xibeiensis]|uniref:hypothetical protein n=1 Tax=Pyxidicoccus xibeiensis TaxID=2906759 RepID=UPI0020A7BEEB|nr:hypothetical protein [Pyxidicoccus xibeiensis]MCP3144447.1 hypothetical protein [Pyxidicoccus xibeiensis]